MNTNFKYEANRVLEYVFPTFSNPSAIFVLSYRADLTKRAEKASVEVFACNLKRLLLTPPVRGKVVLGIDPGFRNGCKYAVTSPTGNTWGLLWSRGWDERVPSEARWEE